MPFFQDKAAVLSLYSVSLGCVWYPCGHQWDVPSIREQTLSALLSGVLLGTPGAKEVFVLLLWIQRKTWSQATSLDGLCFLENKCSCVFLRMPKSCRWCLIWYYMSSVLFLQHLLLLFPFVWGSLFNSFMPPLHKLCGPFWFYWNRGAANFHILEFVWNDLLGGWWTDGNRMP